MASGARARRIGVVGCGTAGPVAALLLARQGREVALFERSPRLRPVGAGFLLQPTGMAVLARLGLLEDVLRDGARVARLTARTANGRTILDLAYADLAADWFGLGLHRATLMDHLTRALARAGVTPVLGFDASSLIRSNDGLRLQSGDGAEAGPFDLVVGADGARSLLRSALWPGTRSRTYPWGALWAVLPDPGIASAVRFARSCTEPARCSGSCQPALARVGRSVW